MNAPGRPSDTELEDLRLALETWAKLYPTGTFGEYSGRILAELKRARDSEERKTRLLRDVLAKVAIYQVAGPELYWAIRKEIDS